MSPSGRVDDLDPGQRSGDDERRVLQVVRPGMEERVVIGAREVPAEDRGDPDREGHVRANQDSKEWAQRRDLPQRERRKEEEGKRAAQREH